MNEEEPEDEELELPQPPMFNFKRIAVFSVINIGLQLGIRYALDIHWLWAWLVATGIMVAVLLVKTQLFFWNLEWEEEQLSIDVQVEDFRRQLDEH
jgi:hypothetical protein